MTGGGSLTERCLLHRYRRRQSGSPSHHGAPASVSVRTTAPTAPVTPRPATLRMAASFRQLGKQPRRATTSDSERVGDLITIVGYDPTWPDRYAAQQVALRAALGRTAIRIEHIGSTSVPGLAAKPIIDVQVSVTDLTDEDA
jgi:hypothetical protein